MKIGYFVWPGVKENIVLMVPILKHSFYDYKVAYNILRERNEMIGILDHVYALQPDFRSNYMVLQTPTRCLQKYAQFDRHTVP